MRLGLQDFIVQVFWQHHKAKLNTFCDTLIGIRKTDTHLHPLQSWWAAAGYNLAEDRPLFLEQYLNEPSIEAHLKKHLHLNIQRQTMAEVGNLAALEAGGTRALIVHMTQTLHHLGRRWVVFTATQSLINSFQRMGLEPLVLMPALPNKIHEPHLWGRYYENKPYVILGDIAKGYKALLAQKKQLSKFMLDNHTN